MLDAGWPMSRRRHCEEPVRATRQSHTWVNSPRTTVHGRVRFPMPETSFRRRRRRNLILGSTVQQRQSPPTRPPDRYRYSQLQVKKCVKWISTNSSAAEGLSVYVTARSLLGRRGSLMSGVLIPLMRLLRQDPLLSSRDFSRNDGGCHSRIMSGSPVGVYKVRAGAIREKKCVKYSNRVFGL